MANEGGSIHQADKKIIIKPNYNIKGNVEHFYEELLLLRLSTPVVYDLRAAFIPKPPLVPASKLFNYQTQKTEPMAMVASGFHQRSDKSAFPFNNQRMNYKLYQLSTEHCGHFYTRNLDKYLDGIDPYRKFSCTCSYHRYQYCKNSDGTEQIPGHMDDGTGLFVAKQNVLVGVSIARMPNRSPRVSQPLFHMLYKIRDLIVKGMHDNILDEYADFPESVSY